MTIRSLRVGALCLLFPFLFACGEENTDDPNGNGPNGPGPSVSPSGSAANCTPGSAADWAGNTYALTIGVANWTEPRRAGEEIGAFVPQFVLDVKPMTGAELQVELGTARDGMQDLCNPTVLTPLTVTTYPGMQIGPLDFPVHIEHVSQPVVVNATIYGMTMTNVMPDICGPAEDGEFTGTMDFREVYTMFTLIPAEQRSPESVCMAFQDNLEVSCEACPTDNQPFCVTLKAQRLGAESSTLAFQSMDASAVDASCANFDGTQ